MQIYDNLTMIGQQLLNIFFSPLNRLLILAATCQIASMLTKTIIKSIKNKKLSFRNMGDYGGMPSSHTAFVAALIFGIALDKNYGWTHPLFAFAIVISSIVIIDAVRLRGNVDKINLIVREIAKHDHINIDFKVPKLISHKPKEAIAGLIFAFLYTVVFYTFFYHLFK